MLRLQENGYSGQVWPASRQSQHFYRYSVSRTHQRERLLGGVAGDVDEALATLQAHIRFLVAQGVREVDR
jgi:hypothetical protein